MLLKFVTGIPSIIINIDYWLIVCFGNTNPYCKLIQQNKMLRVQFKGNTRVLSSKQHCRILIDTVIHHSIHFYNPMCGGIGGAYPRLVNRMPTCLILFSVYMTPTVPGIWGFNCICQVCLDIFSVYCKSLRTTFLNLPKLLLIIYLWLCIHFKQHGTTAHTQSPE